MTNNRAGFSLIEVIIVVVIISILASMIIAGMSFLGESRKKVQTEATLGVIQAALTRRGAELGGAKNTTVHPFAAWTEPRSRFQRGNESKIESAGATVSTSGLALRTQNVNWAASKGRVLLDDDCFEGVLEKGDAPQFYGCKRFQMRTFSSGSGMVAYEQVTESKGAASSKAFTQQIDTGDLSNTTAFEEETRAFFEYQFTAETLADLKGLGVFTDSNAPTLATTLQNRVRLGKTFIRWQPGHIKLDGQWTQYHLRGHGIYDAYGQEILAFEGPKGFCLASAGQDGHFVYVPGTNKVFDTECWQNSPVGDDRDAKSDNILFGNWE